MSTVQYPLPTVDDVLGNIGTARVFSKIDLQNAYLQLPLDKTSRKYTTINTCQGLYQYNYLSFGISSSPAIFQSYITKVLNGIDNVIVYQDDILVMTATHEEHSYALDKVVNALMVAGLKVNSS